MRGEENRVYADVCRLAQNLARNCGYAVFPCREDKRPACPHGFKQASKKPDEIAELWRRWPGLLIGFATGSASGISVLDVDPKHPETFLWWESSHPLLLPSRTFETRSHGLHLHLRHREGVTNSQGKIAKGIDTRGEGGYAIHWYAAGFACFDHSPPASWPAWLLAELTRQPRAPPPQPGPKAQPHAERAVDGILRRLAAAREGERNGVLFWSACRLDERGMRQAEIEALLLPTAIGIGLSDIEARRTITSAQGRNTGRAAA
jgi:hypothetical protein